MTNAQLGMECFMKDISFCGVLLDSVWGSPALFNVMDMITEAIADGIVSALDTTMFPMDKVICAIEFFLRV